MARKNVTTEPSRESALAKMVAALRATCAEYYPDEASATKRANELLDTLIRRGAVVIQPTQAA